MKPTRILLFTLCATVAISSSTFAQSARSRYAQRDKAGAQPRPLMDDRAFVLSAAQGGVASIELSRLAATNGSSAEVKQYAEMIVDTSEKMKKELGPLLTAFDIPMPEQIDARHKVSRDWLVNLSGADFDRAYMNVMSAKHSNDVTFIRHAAALSQEPDVKAWAARILPVAQEHLTRAMEINRKIGGSAAATR
jgi:putative membrane protein